MPKDDDITKAPWYNKEPTGNDLDQILADHKTWVEAGAEGEPPHDLRGIILRERSLDSVVLAFADLSSADLFFASLMNVDLRNARLIEASLTRADLRNSDLRETILFKAVLARASLAGADLSRAYCEQADFYGADIQRVKLHGVNLTNAYMQASDLRSADLSKANLTHARLLGSKLNSATLKYALLNSAHLAEALLDHADFSFANLEGANLNGASVVGADLRKANLNGAKLLGVDLSKAITDESTTGIRQSRIRKDAPEEGLEGVETVTDGHTVKEPPPSKPSSEEEVPSAGTKENEPPLKLVDEAAEDDEHVDDAEPAPTSHDEIENIAAEAGARAAKLRAEELTRAISKTGSQSRVIAVIDKAASLGRKLFTPLLIACAYTVLTSLKTNNGVDSVVKLPLVQVEMEAPEFYIFSALLLLALHVYFLFYFTRLLENITLTPDVDARGVPRSQLIDPWLVLGVVRVLGPWSVQRPKAMDWAQFPLVMLIVWFPVPITMALVWQACLCRGDWTLTLIQVGSLTLSLIAGVLFFLKAADILERWKLKWWKVVAVMVGCLAVGAALALASQAGFPATPPAATPAG